MSMNFFNASKEHKREKYTLDDRQRAVNHVRGHLRKQAYVEPSFLRALQVLVPELRSDDVGDVDG